jgi:hypothetical protein
MYQTVSIQLTTMIAIYGPHNVRISFWTVYRPSILTDKAIDGLVETIPPGEHAVRGI